MVCDGGINTDSGVSKIARRMACYRLRWEQMREEGRGGRRELRFRCLSRWHDARGTCSGTAEWLQLLGLGVEERDPS